MEILVIDQTAVVISGITGFFGLLSLIATLLINNKVNKVAKEVNGHTTLLLRGKDELAVAKQSASLAQGKLAGMAANDPGIKDISKDESSATVTGKDAVLDVKIVDQDKTIRVTQEKPPKDKT